MEHHHQIILIERTLSLDADHKTLNVRKKKKNEVHYFFNVVSIDQCLNDPFLILMMFEMKTTLAKAQERRLISVCLLLRSAMISMFSAFQEASS